MSDKPIKIEDIPADLRDRYLLLKACVDAGRYRTSHTTYEFAKEILRYIERIARLEAPPVSTPDWYES